MGVGKRGWGGPEVENVVVGGDGNGQVADLHVK